jgi:Flp pilus assembly pilin Flp
MKRNLAANLRRTSPAKPAARKGARGRERGVVVVEYAFLLVIVAVPALVAIIAAGVQLADGYTQTRNQLLHVGP